MCGITGFWDKRQGSKNLALQMAEKVHSRGPDGSGAWLSSNGCLAMSHRRLAVIDLSSSGHQPMVSNCGRHVIVFNGEIYNHESLRKELSSVAGKISWQGHSDGEVLLNCLQHWGFEGTLSKLNGMYAIAYWSELKQSLFLAIDRMGEKPLYYGQQGGTFLFGSELKALKAHPSFSSYIDRNALALYLRHSYIPAPHSIYQKIYKLKPAHYVVIKNYGIKISDQHCYWNLSDVVEKGLSNQHTNERQALENLEYLLKDSVKSRMMSDVPLGAFLSGGYDSSTVVALMQAQSTNPVKTFSIGFQEDAFNEANYAREVASYLKTEHTELYVEASQALEVIPQLPKIYDEPFADPSQIPTILLSKLAKQHVTVALSGDGGDELFCGYSRYNQGYRIWSQLSILPESIRKVLAWLCRTVPGECIDSLQRLLPKCYRVSNLAYKLPKLSSVIDHNSGSGFYKTIVSQNKNPTNLVLNSKEAKTILDSPLGSLDGIDLRNKMMYLDELTYLPGDILTKVDRASMAVSLEARVPLLDHRLVEFAWSLPLDLKIKNGQGKWPLKQVLYKYVPKTLMERPKKGFGLPVKEWLQGPLKDWASELLDEERLRREGYFNPILISKMWNDHLMGKHHWHFNLWTILMFQAWLENED